MTYPSDKWPWSHAYPVACAGQPSGQAGGARDLHDVDRRPTDRQNSHYTHKGGLAHARPNYVYYYNVMGITMQALWGEP